MIEVRKVLETSNVRFAVLRARDEDLAALKEILEQSRSQIANKAAFIKSDYAFHQAIAVASGNSILATMLQTMRTMMSDFNSQLLTSQEGRQQVYAHHKKSSRPSLTATRKRLRTPCSCTSKTSSRA